MRQFNYRKRKATVWDSEVRSLENFYTHIGLTQKAVSDNSLKAIPVSQSLRRPYFCIDRNRGKSNQRLRLWKLLPVTVCVNSRALVINLLPVADSSLRAVVAASS